MEEGYKLYKWLQKPLVFKGLKGRFIFIGAAAGVSTLLVAIIASTIAGLWAGAVAMFLFGGISFFIVISKQSKGLHSKSVGEGLYIVRKVVLGRLDV